MGVLTDMDGVSVSSDRLDSGEFEFICPGGPTTGVLAG